MRDFLFIRLVQIGGLLCIHEIRNRCCMLHNVAFRAPSPPPRCVGDHNDLATCIVLPGENGCV